LSIPTEEFQSIVRIFAAGYLRLRAQRRREQRLANAPISSLHGHEVNGIEKRETHGDRDAETD
jgi:hypothetical protein